MKSIVFLSLVLFTLSAKGQNKNGDVYDTARRMDPMSGSVEQTMRNHLFDLRKDSSLLYLQQYDRTRKEHIAIQNLGDVNTPFIDLQFRPDEQSGFNGGTTPFSNLFFKPDSSRFYNARLPYSEFHYAQGKGGQRGMIDFDAFHTQNFGKQFNISALYHSTSNDGFYSRQSLSAKNLLLSSVYITRNKRYSISGIYTWNKVNMMENGGIEQSPSTDSLFRELPASVRLVAVSLQQARNIVRYSEFRIDQVYWLMMDQNTDTLQGRSGTLGIRHRFSSARRSAYYTDAAGDYGFYDSVYQFNADYSADTFSVKEYSNSLELVTPLRKNGISFRTGIRYDRILAMQAADPGNYTRLSTHNSSVYGQLGFQVGSVFRSEVFATYYPEGYNRNDYLLKWSMRTVFGRQKQWSALASFLSSSRRPAYRQERMLGNHYEWMQSLQSSRQQTLTLIAGKNTRRPAVYNAYYYSLPPRAFEVQLSYSLTDRMVYHRSDGTPAQTGEGLSVLQGLTRFQLGTRHFRWQQEIAAQVFSEALKNTLQLPALMSKSSIWYQTYAFKKASFIQIGLDMSVTSSYRAGLYNPALQNFMISEKAVGAYPWIDLYVNAEIRTARIFFKMEHINQDIPGKYHYPNYFYASPYQPSAPRRFRLGFVWKFYY